QNRQAFAGNLVYRRERQTHPVRERQVLVDERPLGQRFGIELPRRQQNLTIASVDDVTIIVDRDEIVVRADGLYLPESLKQRIAIPEAHILNRRRIGADVGETQAGVTGELSRVDVRQTPRLPRRTDVVSNLRQLVGQLRRRDYEPLHCVGEKSPCNNRDRDVGGCSSQGEEDDSPPEHPVQ